MKLNALIGKIPGKVQTIGDMDVEITSLCVDSRKAGPGALFFCTPGLRVDAHDFAPQAVKLGAVALVVQRELPLDVPQVRVEDVRTALSYMAAEYFGNPAEKLMMLGITGTKGKTTTSFLVKSIMEAAGVKTGLIGTVCSMIGEETLPNRLTTPDPIETQTLLRRMVDAGMECFRDMDAYFAAKMKLMDPAICETIVYNVDDERVGAAIKRLDMQKLRIGIRESSDVYANDIEIGERGCSFLMTWHKHFRTTIDLHLAGIFNVYNALMAAGICICAGVGPESIRQGLENVTAVPGRIELLDTGTPYRVILDYAHSPDSLENVLNAVRQTARGRMIALFGCGGDRDKAKRPMMGEIGGKLADYCILTSDNPRNEDPMVILDAIEAGIKPTGCDYIVIENRREAIRYALTHAEPGDVVVLAGKGHETYQDIKGVKHPFDEKVVVRELLEEI